MSTEPQHNPPVSAELVALPQCPFPCGWSGLHKIAVQDAAYLAKVQWPEDEEGVNVPRATAMRSMDYLIQVCRTMLNAAPVADQTRPEIEGVTLDGCLETLFRIGEYLDIDYAQARKAPEAPSNVYIKAIEDRVAAQAKELTLDKPAKVGNGRFGVGVKWSTVIAAAQRHYEYEVTPTKEAERIKEGAQKLGQLQELIAVQAQPELCNNGCRCLAQCGDVYAHEGKPQPEQQPVSGADGLIDGVAQFTKKPVTISAIQWTGGNLKEVIAFTGMHPRFNEWFSCWDEYAEHVGMSGGIFKIFTLEGVMEATPGDWIIRGVKGEHYPCKPDIFAATYSVGQAQQDADKVDAALAEMVHAMFRSGNSVPVPRITIDRKQYDAVAGAARKEPDQ